MFRLMCFACLMVNVFAVTAPKLAPKTRVVALSEGGFCKVSD